MCIRDSPDGVLGVDHFITGDGTNSVFLNGVSVGTNPGNHGYSFRGTIDITGEWQGIRVKAQYDPDRAVSLGGTSRLDANSPISLRDVVSTTVVPEPSTALLTSFMLLGLLQRRR